MIKPSVKPQPVTNDYGNRTRAQANINRAQAAAQAAAKQEAAREAAREAAAKEAAAKAAAAESAAPVNRENRQSDLPRTNNGERRNEPRSGERSQFQSRENGSRERQNNRSAAGTKAGEMKAAAARVIKTVRRVRLAALLGINLFIITGAVLDRIAETQLPENESGRGKALVWIHNRLRQD